MDKIDSENKRINCYKCVYHQITWQTATPYACLKLGFKSRVIPSLEVFRSSGLPCQYFTNKDNKK